MKQRLEAAGRGRQIVTVVPDTFHVPHAVVGVPASRAAIVAA